ncbi:hypothetical protein P8935_11630 [Telmatobacter sp. DSM 110680]|uniref:Uncharacterized protein n=1 Tax=Telmatobacter sp. DSM 110680 TaxID=3036704 RepID=A0AAU7DRK2_9BACT
MVARLIAVAVVMSAVGLLTNAGTLHAVPQTDGQFKRYKTVEAYEIRTGVLMMPRYALDGQVCEIGLQKRIYSPEVVRLDAELERKQIDDLVDELVPAEERGPRANGILGMGLISVSGTGMNQLDDYENVSIDVYSKVLSSSKRKMTVEGNLAAVIRWKHRKCQ